ncbi:MAG: 16S rRNA (cytidine(1402)-2'-O)-methyltransferase [Desulfobacterales bacterium]|nr:16S rRNA (cytidine(1402)-2'-O)-methyltransferase [Desulfobacterales bacterium]
MSDLISKPVDQKGELFVIATPIGNKDDITLRALRILAEVDLIAAEDTRHTGKLLSYHKIKGHYISYHEHNESEQTLNLIKKLKAGASIALVSNAGTPSVSDPGYRLVKEALANEIRVTPVPGVSAAISALSVAGLPTDSFIFIGFPPPKKNKRLKQLKELADQPRTIIFYESPRRILTLLQEVLLTMGDRYCVLSREMTKLHEEFIRGFISEIIRQLDQRASIKGECTLLVKGCAENETVSMETIRSELIQLLKLKEKRLSEISREVAQKYNLSSKSVYTEALKIKNDYSL